MKTFLNHISNEAGWNDATRIEVLMDFLTAQVAAGNITTDDFTDYLDERAADEKAMGDEDMEVVKVRCRAIVEKYKDTMDPSCTVILEEMYEENIDSWKDGHKVYVFMGIKQEFKCSLSKATTIGKMLFGEETG